MKFVHEDKDWAALLGIVAKRESLATALVEKDYWVTHTLWALQEAGLELWFKGGTSLSKAFGLIQRFSEDLDLKIEPGTLAGVPTATSWKSEGTKATTQRKEHFERLTTAVKIPGCSLVLDPDADVTFRNGSIRVFYPGKHATELPQSMRPYVLLEVGEARVAPAVKKDVTSFVHRELDSQKQLASFRDNRPVGLRCVHPLVTLIEKLDALQRKARNETMAPAGIVRHYEDAARIIEAASLPALEGHADPKALAEEMAAQKQIRNVPAEADPAFSLPDDARTQAIRAAYLEIGPMFWGTRLTLDDSVATIRAWIRKTLG